MVTFVSLIAAQYLSLLGRFRNISVVPGPLNMDLFDQFTCGIGFYRNTEQVLHGSRIKTPSL